MRTSPRPDVILASASPRRLALLAAIGIVVRSRPAEIDETALPEERAEDLVLRLARVKADHVRESPAEVIVAADTVVHDPDLHPAIVGKPVDAADARRVLTRLAGREHCVITGYSVSCGDRRCDGVVISRVRLRRLGAAEIDAYVATGEPLDKAGAYGVQGLGAALVESIAGSYSCVVGLPMREVLASIDRVRGP